MVARRQADGQRRELGIALGEFGDRVDDEASSLCVGVTEGHGEVGEEPRCLPQACAGRFDRGQQGAEEPLLVLGDGCLEERLFGPERQVQAGAPETRRPLQVVDAGGKEAARPERLFRGDDHCLSFVAPWPRHTRILQDMERPVQYRLRDRSLQKILEGLVQ